jgi:acetylornithine deacetylase/succinyl-diaminopimelate desuccinylase-like protein
MRRTAALLLPLALGALSPRAAAASAPLDLLAAYLRIETTDRARREAEAADLLARALHAAGQSTERYVTPSGRVHLAARLPATVPGAPTLVLLHHLDVVPPGPGWTVEPFAGLGRDGALWGRGAIDAKSLGIAHLEAFLATAALPERRRGLLFLAVSDEENGGRDGALWLLERHPTLFEGVEAVLNEGGANRTVLGRTVYWGIEVEQKRPLWLEATASGRPGHGAALAPASAAHTLVRALARLVERPALWRVDPAARRYLEALGAWDPNARRLAERLDEAIRPEGPTVALQPGQPILFLDTLQVTMLEASDRVNVVSEQARARLDIRLLPTTDADAFLAGVREALGPEIEVRVLLDSPPAPPSPAEGALWQELARGLGRGSPVVPLFVAGVTDSRHFRARGIPAYGLSPFELEGVIAQTVHGPDERIPVVAFERGVDRMKALVERLVAPEGGEP